MGGKCGSQEQRGKFKLYSLNKRFHIEVQTIPLDLELEKKALPKKAVDFLNEHFGNLFTTPKPPQEQCIAKNMSFFKKFDSKSDNKKNNLKDNPENKSQCYNKI